MSGTDYSFDGLDALEQQLAQMIEEEYPKEFEAMVIQLAYDLQGRVKEKTPVKTSHLRDEWKVGKIQKRGDEYYINELYHEIAERVSFDQLDKICEALHCSLEELLEYIPNKQPHTGENLILEQHGNRLKKPR